MARILVTESEPGMRRMLGAVVAHAGHETVTLEASAGRAPCDAVDVILLDPSNAPALAWVRAHRGADLSAPIICLLGDHRTRASPDLGPVACLHRPYGFSQVRWALEEALRCPAPLEPGSPTA